jgi:hypothetical protein
MLATDKFEYADYIENNTIWTVKLNNGEEIFGVEIGQDAKNAWIELKTRCENEDLYIQEMTLSFRNHVKQVPPNKDGYFLRKAVRGVFGSAKSREFIIVGYVENGRVHVTKWSAPALLKDIEETRSIEDCEDSIIWRSTGD